MATGQGVITFDFGAAPGTNLAQALVEDAAIGADSKVEIYLMGLDSTADHNAYEHALLPLGARRLRSHHSEPVPADQKGRLALTARL